MTTPGGVPNLPQGALTIDTLASKTQDMSQSAMRDRAAERFPNIFNSSSGGNPLSDLTPLGILTQIFAGFNSVVANADPNDIEGPEDLPGLLLDFIESLPVIGELIGLLEAILGTYDGDDEVLLTVQEIFAPIRKLVELVSGFNGDGFPSVEGIISGFADILKGDSPLNALNLFGSLLPGLFSNVPIGALNNSQPNQWTQGEFPTADSIADNPVWTWDPAVGRNAAGSARCTATGVLKVLRREPIPVAEGQTIDMQAWVRWVGLIYTGTPLRLGVRTFTAGTEPNSWQLLNTIDLDAVGSLVVNSSDHPDADADDFVELSATWTVPAGVAAYTPRLIVDNTATAGTVWFDDGSGQQTGLIQQPWVSNLPEDLQALLDWIENLVDNLLDAVGLSGVGTLLDKIFDLSDEFGSWFGDSQTSFGNLSDLTGRFSDLLSNVFNGLQGGVPDLGGIDALIDAVTDALGSIPFLNVLGIGGPGDIGGSVQSTWDQWIGGLVGAVGSGSGLSDLFNIGQDISSRATLGQFSWDILGIRNNKSFSTGMLSSSNSSIPLTQVAVGGSAPTFGVTSTTAITLYERVQESGECGVVRWMGSGTTNITGFFLNIYQMDPTTGDRTCVYTSGDIKADLSASMTTNKHVLSTPIQREPGEIYGYELALTGTGTHTVVGQSSWIHADPDVYPRKMSSVRSGGSVTVGTVQTSGTITYGSNIPFIETAVALDGVEIPRTPVTTVFNTAQTGTTLPIPSWCNTVEVVAVGGGGGGRQGGTWGVSGEGGDNGNWATATWTRGAEFTGSPSISITVPAKATGGTGIGDNGGNAVASITGHTVTATGGEGGDALNAGGSDKNGQSPGNITYGGVTYVGGGTQSSFGGNGAAPGGGGAGGNYVSFQAGGDGALGAVWIRFKQ